jgi:hypothetical protein
MLKDKDSTTEYMTDEILSMMLFNDIHDCPMHPIRENNFIDYFKDKYPFNRDLGIDTSENGTDKYINGLVDFIKQNHLETILIQLKKPIEVDPLNELKNLQALDDFYMDEAPESEKDLDEKDSVEGEEQDNGFVIPQQIFYEFEQVRRSQLTNFPVFNEKGEKEFSDKEIEDKVHYMFIHDKVVFDTFNSAINWFDKRRETQRPWIKQTQAAYERPYSVSDILSLFEKSKNKLKEWNDISAGTRKIPPPSLFDNFNQMNENMNDTMQPSQMSDEERLQQLREERLSLLLSREIQEED